MIYYLDDADSIYGLVLGGCLGAWNASFSTFGRGTGVARFQHRPKYRYTVRYRHQISSPLSTGI